MAGIALDTKTNPYEVVEAGILGLHFSFTGATTPTVTGGKNLVSVVQGNSAGNGYVVTITGVSNMSTAVRSIQTTLVNFGTVGGTTKVELSTTADLTIYVVDLATVASYAQLATTESCHVTIDFKEGI